MVSCWVGYVRKKEILCVSGEGGWRHVIGALNVMRGRRSFEVYQRRKMILNHF